MVQVLCGSSVRPQASAEASAQRLTLTKVRNQVLSTSAAVVAAVTLAASPALAAGSQIGYAQKPVQPSTDLISELKEKSTQNKALNDKKRFAQSYSHLASSRTVTDRTCYFPKNLFGCDDQRLAGNVKFITDSQQVECQDRLPGKCVNKVQAEGIANAFN